MRQFIEISNQRELNDVVSNLEKNIYKREKEPTSKDKSLTVQNFILPVESMPIYEVISFLRKIVEEAEMMFYMLALLLWSLLNYKLTADYNYKKQYTLLIS